MLSGRGQRVQSRTDPLGCPVGKLSERSTLTSKGIEDGCGFKFGFLVCRSLFSRCHVVCVHFSGAPTAEKAHKISSVVPPNKWLFLKADLGLVVPPIGLQRSESSAFFLF